MDNNVLLNGFEEGLDNYIKVELEAKSENEKLARNIIASFLIEKNPRVELLSDVKTAVSEAVTNAVVHAYKGKGGKIELEGRLKGNLLYVKVTDFGVGIQDIDKAMQPFFTTGKEDERSGLGFTVMETFMDKLNVLNNKSTSGLVVEMVKNIKTETL